MSMQARFTRRDWARASVVVDGYGVYCRQVGPRRFLGRICLRVDERVNGGISGAAAIDKRARASIVDAGYYIPRVG